MQLALKGHNAVMPTIDRVSDRVMRPPAFRSLDEPARQFLDRKLAWPPERYAAFAAAMKLPRASTHGRMVGWARRVSRVARQAARRQQARDRDAVAQDVGVDGDERRPLAGARDLEQLARWVTDEVYRNLSKRVVLAARARRAKGLVPQRRDGRVEDGVDEDDRRGEQDEAALGTGVADGGHGLVSRWPNCLGATAAGRRSMGASIGARFLSVQSNLS